MTRHENESNIEHLDARRAEIDRREERPEKETRGFMREAGEHRLSALTEEAWNLHKQACYHTRNAFKYAVRCGEVLNQIKPQIKHGGYKGQGGWIKYVKECGIPYRTANRYCLIADHKDLWPKNEYATVAHSYGVVKLEEHIKHQLKKPRTHSAKAHTKRKKGKRTGSDAIAVDKFISEFDAFMGKIEKLDEDDKKVVLKYMQDKVFRFDEEDESSDNMKDASAV